MTQENRRITATREVELTRVIDAPRELVYRAWTDPAHMARWWGPRMFTNPVCEMDVRPGGAIRIVMRAPDGTEHPMTGEFREVDPLHRLVFMSVPRDAGGAALIECLTTVLFADAPGGKTKLIVRESAVGLADIAIQMLGGMEIGLAQSLDKLEEMATGVEDRVLVVMRAFDAPRELVFDAWTDPKHIAQWWGPNGFTTTIHERDVRPGGVWRFMMHGPDGVDYPNRIVYTEIVRPERIAYIHGSGVEGEPDFQATVTFADWNGKTFLTLRLLMATEEVCRKSKEFGAIEGGNQTLGRLAAYLAEGEFVLSREFAAPRDLVFKAWTEADRLQQWFGPTGFTMFSCKMDLRPGGLFHYGMRSPDGHELWAKWVFREIAPPERIVYVLSFSDAQAGTTLPPMAAGWPLEMLWALTLAERDGKTTVTLRGVPINATDAERETFAANHDSMQTGWGGTLDQLEAYLSKP